MDLFEHLQKNITGEVALDDATRAAHAEDKSPFHITPRAVVFPKNSSDIEAVVRFVREQKVVHPELSITARSAGSDVTGGPLSESIVLDVTKFLNHLIAIGQSTATVQPGMFYRDFEIETLRHNLLLPSFPASRDLCAVGGMVGNNSGGEKTLMYGKTAKYVRKLHVVLSDGNEYIIEPLSGNALTEKLAEQNEVGRIYRELYALITENFITLQHARPRVSKNSAGYALWDVWNPDTGVFDLTKLFTGSQGTLGIITEITFDLVNPTKYSRMLVIFLDDLSTVPKVVATVLPYKPETFEVYDKSVLKIILRFFPQFIKLLGGNIFRLVKDFIPEMKIIIRNGSMPSYILTAEITGDNVQEIEQRAKNISRALKGLPVKTHITTSEQEAQKYRTIRRQSFGLLQKHTKHKQTVTFIDDVIVRPEKLPIFIPRLRALLDTYPSVDYSIIGHIGDGNLHIIPLMDLGDPETPEIIDALTHAVNELVLELDGSITAEHNDGLTRSPFLRQMFGDEVYALFEKTKSICDPENIFNPNKKVHANFSYALDHLKRSRKTK